MCQRHSLPTPFSAEGKLGGEFFTPTCVVRLLVRMLEPYRGRVFDPCCGSGGMFVQPERFVEEHQGRIGDISIFGQESNPTTWKLAPMNLAIRGIEAHRQGDLQGQDRRHGLSPVEAPSGPATGRTTSKTTRGPLRPPEGRSGLSRYSY